MFFISMVAFFTTIPPTEYCYFEHLPHVSSVLLRSLKICICAYLKFLFQLVSSISDPCQVYFLALQSAAASQLLLFFLFEFLIPLEGSVTRGQWYGSGKKEEIWNLSLFFLLGGLGLRCGISGQRPPWTCNLNSTNPHFLSSSSDDLFPWETLVALPCTALLHEVILW